MRTVAAIATIAAALATPSVSPHDDMQSGESHAASVLIVQRGYDGPVESAGVVIAWQYTGSSMYLEWADTTTDGVFRNGFEVAL